MSPEVKLLYYKSIIEDQRKQIERMKRSGRRRRDEVKALKKSIHESCGAYQNCDFCDYYEEVIHDQEQLINLMMIAGRKRREEIKRLKKKLNGNAITMMMDSDGNLWWN